jgi:uncharacterized protein
VHWREWGDEAFREAQEQDKPLALFDTAFWCGFCQRMDETSLSDDQVIALLNAFFVPVRFEESQRPDLDLRYNQNGWPTIGFFTPAGAHLASVNYTPPEDFVGVLVRLVDFYQQNHDALSGLEAERPASPQGDGVPLTSALVEEVAGILDGLADREYGGYGLDLKLLHPAAIDFALYLYETRGEHEQLEHVVLTLTKLRDSRTFDAQDGGFFRYSSRRDWQEPHPEKLLADQAALLSQYLDLYLLTGDLPHRDTAEGLIRYLDRTLTTDETRPGFAGCQDYLHGAGGHTGLGAERPYIIDHLVYCDANARAASAYLKAWWYLGREDCRDRAVLVLDMLWDRMRGPDGGMHHYWQDGAYLPGLLCDALAMGDALLDAHAALGDERSLHRAREVAEYVTANHPAPGGGFYDIGRLGPGKLGVPLTLMTENAEAAMFFTRLADLSGDAAYRGVAARALACIPNSHREHGAFAAAFGHALARWLSPPLLVKLTGRPGAPDTLALLRAARTQLRHPNVVVRYHDAAGDTPGPTLNLAGNGVSYGQISDPEQLSPALLFPDP